MYASRTSSIPEYHFLDALVEASAMTDPTNHTMERNVAVESTRLSTSSATTTWRPFLTPIEGEQPRSVPQSWVLPQHDPNSTK